MDSRSNLNNPILLELIVSIMVRRLGGSVHITQEDIDDIAYNRLEEDVEEDGSITFRFIQKGQMA